MCAPAHSHSHAHAPALDADARGARVRAEVSPDVSPATLVTGDALCALAALLYAFSNVLEESLLEEASVSEVLAFLGMFGAVFNAVQFSLVEHAALARIVWTGETGACRRAGARARARC